MWVVIRSTLRCSCDSKSVHLLPSRRVVVFFICQVSFLSFITISASVYANVSNWKKKTFHNHLYKPSVMECLFQSVLPAHPQPPTRPMVPQRDVQARQVLLSWEPGSDGLSPVRYYTVQLRELPERNWTVHSASVNHEATSYIVPR